MVASSLSAFQILTGTISSILTEPPYNFSTNAVGLAYIGPTVGTIFSCILSGPFTDWFCIWIARRRGGTHEAEDRIYIGLTALILEPVGLIIYGVGAAHGIHWIGVIFGLGIVGAGMSISQVIPYTYALDACRDIGSDAIVAIVLMRNTISFAFTYSITPWIESQGLQNTFLTVAFVLGVAFWLTGIPMIKYGKWLRRRTAGTYYSWCTTH